MNSKNSAVEVVHKGRNSLVQFGLPIRKSYVWHVYEIELYMGEKKLVSNIAASGFWEDGSIRWLKIQVLITQSGTLSISLNKTAKPLASSENQSDKLVQIKDNILHSTQEFPLNLHVNLRLSGQDSPLKINELAKIHNNNGLTSEYYLSGAFVFEDKTLKLCCNIHECTLTGEINIEVRLHNPTAAAHVGGKWDLGDKNSVIVDDFSIIFEYKELQTKLFLKDALSSSNQLTIENENFTLSQLGSGGEHWESPIHWNEHKQSTVKKQGFHLQKSGGDTLSGLRAEPTLFVNTEDRFVQISLDGFWQNFPAMLKSKKGESKWQLLSKDTELQGGESKTWRFTCVSGNSDEINNKTIGFDSIGAPEITFNTHYINQCEVLPHVTLSTESTKLTQFINLTIEGKHNFFEKREAKDVYGWRNYGELDADHEAVNAPEDSYFISHYNNQYDPLMGMTLQFLHSSNPKWLALIHPLNQHIQDIDIYDTNQDKAEYNGGLMWHTDHYLSAETCTHRSNSIFHEHAYDGFLGGGGPGGQHCYTTGLALQYRLFADESAKCKVIQLSNWIRCFYNGSGSIAERTFRLLTIDMKQNELTNIGVKAPGYKYPLDRGTANYLNALIDCFDVTDNPKLLVEMGEVVRGTFHPKDKLDTRDLKNIENAWFYTVFLQAVVRYLLLKETRNSIDSDYWYARHALLHYGKWMLVNEKFYLTNAEKLEFPNDTWCAQDTRKMNLFCYFYYFDSTKSDAYLEKADEYYQYIVKHMAKSKEAHFARILALLMQNDGVIQKFGLGNVEVLAPKSSIALAEKDFNAAPTFSRYAIAATYLRDTTKLLFRFSLKAEWKWLSLRLNSVLNK